MKKYTDLIGKSSSSAILEALNRGTGNAVSTFGSVDQFIQGILGSNFIRDTKKDYISDKNNDTNNIKDELKNNIFKGEKESSQLFYNNREGSQNINNNETPSNSLYKIYKDTEEIFECNISIKGANLENAQVRLILENEIFNIFFYGKVYSDGKCLVQLKKMSIYPEGAKGKIKLEVIVDDTIFVPWEETFIVKSSKKIKVDIKNKKKKF